MAALNYAEQYFRALSQAFPYVLNYGALYTTPNNQRYKPIDAKTIKIPHIKTTGRWDGDRDTISGTTREVDNDWEVKVLTNHRMWKTLIHPVDIIQTNQVLTIQNITQVYNEEQKFPEMDAYCISKIYTDFTALGKQVNTTVLTEENILSVVDELMEQMDEKRVPQNGRILYCTPAVKRLLKNAQGLARNLQVDVTGDKAITRTLSRIEELNVIPVTSDLMKTAYNFTKGWAPGASAKQINLMMIHPLAVYTPVVYSFAQLDPPAAGSDGKYVYFEESFEDIFILNNKADAIAFNVAPDGQGG